MKKTLIILLTFITALITTLPFAANSASEATQKRQSVVMETYDASDGMIPGFSFQIYQDRKGDLWIATTEGVSRYDGKQFHNLTMKDGLPDIYIKGIVEDDKGNFWFATENGVARYDGKQFQVFTEKEGLSGNKVWAIFKDSKGRLWFGTDQGVCYYDGKQFHQIGPGELTIEEDGEIIEDRHGHFWFSTGRKNYGIFRFDGEYFQHYTEKDGLISNFVAAILEDSLGNLWFGGYDGISRYDGEKFRSFKTGGDEGLPVGGMILDILEDRSGNLWFAGRNGLCRYDGKQHEMYTIEDGLPANWARKLLQDGEGNLWVGIYTAGIVRLERNFQNLGQVVVGPFKDKRGRIWCSLSKGSVSQFDGESFQPYLTQDDKVPADAVLQYIDDAGNLWLQSSDSLWRYDGQQLQRHVTRVQGMPREATLSHIDASDNLWFLTNNGAWIFDGRSFNHIVKTTWRPGIFESRQGDIWFVRSREAAYRYRDGILSRVTTANGPYKEYTYTIAEDSMGNIWMGTGGKPYGAFRSKEPGSDYFIPVPEFSNMRVPHIFRDKTGVLWIGTRNIGLCRYDGKRFQWFNMDDGLASNWVNKIYQDRRGDLWLGSRDGGVTHYDGRNFQRLTRKDGLLSNAVQKIIEDEKTGTMLFTTEHGIIRYSPPAKRMPPRISVERIIADKSYDDISEIQLPSTATHITFEYYGKSFRTKQMRYNYILEGFESDWHKTWDERAEYENLKPGNYTFKVIAIDRDLVYSEEPAVVKLKVVPPLYLRAGFLVPTVGFVTILLAMLTIVSIGYIKRRRQVQAYQRGAVEELRDANRVQMSLMPETAPELEGVEIAGRCIPANTVSGDFFDYLEGKRKNEIALVVADVTGKAMKGAMNAVMTDGILRMAAEEMESLSPASLMAKINNVLKTRMEQYMNVTMVIGTIDVDAKTLTLANAAHHAHPILLRLGLSAKRIETNGEVQTLKTGGLPLGMRAGIEYNEEQFLLESGDVVILMSDGIIEAEDSEGQPYSDSGRLEETVSQFTLDLSAKAMVDAILNDAMNFGGDKAQRDDDMTVVVAKIR